MKTDDMRQSENVELVQRESRSYGGADVTRNMSSGIVTAINPVDLQNNCKGALAAEFMHAMMPDKFPKPALPLMDTLKQKTDLTPQDACAVKARSFMDEVNKEGLAVQVNSNLDLQRGVMDTLMFAAKPPTFK